MCIETHRPPPTGQSSPRRFFQSVEIQANKAYKIIRQSKGNHQEKNQKRSAKEAEQLINLILQLAKYGQKVSAQEATELADYIDVLIEMIGKKFDMP